MNIGGPALGREPHDCRDGENKTQAPQDSLPFAITRGQHNAIGVNLEHAAQRMPGWRPRTTLCSYNAANRYALRMYSRISADSRSICCTRCLTTSPIDTIPTRRP